MQSQNAPNLYLNRNHQLIAPIHCCITLLLKVNPSILFYYFLSRNLHGLYLQGESTWTAKKKIEWNWSAWITKTVKSYFPSLSALLLWIHCQSDFLYTFTDSSLKFIWKRTKFFLFQPRQLAKITAFLLSRVVRCRAKRIENKRNESKEAFHLN